MQGAVALWVLCLLLIGFFGWLTFNAEKKRQQRRAMYAEFRQQEAEDAARRYRPNDAVLMRFSYAFAANCCDGSRFASHAHGAVSRQEVGPQRQA